MSDFFTVKPTFAGGEFAKSLHSRVDLELYSSGAKTLRNFFVHPHGGISNRPGLHYIATGKTSGKKIRLVPFEFSTQQTYIIEFGDQYCRFYTNGGQIQSGPAAYEISTPYLEADLFNLNFTQSADVMYIAHPDYAPRELARSSDTSWALSLYDYTGGPFQTANADSSKTLAISNVAIGTGRTLTAVGFTFDEDHVSSLWKLNHYIEGQSVNSAITGTGATSNIVCGGTWRLITHGIWTATIRVEKSIDGGSTWTMLREFTSSDDFNAETYGSEILNFDDDPFLIRINCTSYTSGTCNINLSSDPYYQLGICKITAVAVGGATATVDVVKTFGLTTATDDWAEGSWCAYRGWPTIVEFHPEDRLVWGNTVNEPQTYWMTRIGNYSDFSRSDPLVASDGISSPVPSRKVNGINGLVALAEMIVLTSSCEAIITTDSGPLTPSTVRNVIQGYEGSYGVRPVVIGNRAVYVQSTGAIIRDIGFEDKSSSFVGGDLTIKSNHLFTGYSIVDIDYQQNPDRLVWAVRSDGKLLSMTYLREQEVIAWTWHDTGESGAGTDEFESVACIRGSGYDEVWVSVKRGSDRFVERFDNRMNSTDPEDQFFVDAGITYDGAAATTITGLDHLEGKEVICLADGNVVTGKTVSGGEIELDEEASKVHVGLQYYADMETLDIEEKTSKGTLQGQKLKVSPLIFDLLNSRSGYIGPDSDNLKALSNQGRENWDDPLDLYTGPQKDVLSGGYTDGGNVFFRQSDPLPVTILSLIYAVTVGGMSLR